jgi:hypothetical protein
VTKVVLLDSDQLGLQLVSDFGQMQVTRSLIRFVGPYDDSMGLNTLAELVMAELSLREERLGSRLDLCSS